MRASRSRTYRSFADSPGFHRPPVRVYAVARHPLRGRRSRGLTMGAVQSVRATSVGPLVESLDDTADVGAG